MKKRIISLLLAMVMIFGVLPVTALADGESIVETGETVVGAAEDAKEDAPAPNDDSEEEKSNIEEENKEDISKEEVDELSLLAAEPVAYAAGEDTDRNGWNLIFTRTDDRNVKYVISAAGGQLKDVVRNNATDYTFTLKTIDGTTTIGGTAYYNYHVTIKVGTTPYYLTGNSYTENLGISTREQDAATFLIKTAKVNCHEGHSNHSDRLCLFLVSDYNSQWQWGQAVEYDRNLTLCAENEKNKNNWNVCCDAYDLETEDGGLVVPEEYKVTITKEYSGVENNETATGLTITLTKDGKGYTFTDEDGDGEFTYEGTLPAGTYTITETNANTIDGYTWVSKDKDTITIPASESSEPEVSTQGLFDGIVDLIDDFFSGGHHHPGEGDGDKDDKDDKDDKGETGGTTEPTVPETNKFEFTVTNTYTKNQYNYTVEYYYDGDIDNSATENKNADYGDVINNYTPKLKDGYKFEKAVGLPLTISESENVIKVYYVTNTFTLTVHYVYEDKTTAAPDHTETLAVGANYAVTSPTITGYTPSQDTVSGTMPSEDVTFTVTYTKRSDLSYTVNYYWNGTTTTVKDSQTFDEQTFGEKVTVNPATVDGYTPTSGSKTLTIAESGNVITFYYYKNVTLTANSDERTYNGSEQTVEGYTHSETGKDITFEGVTASGKGTNAGTYPVTFSEGAKGKVDNTQKYIVTDTVNGQLIINKLELTYVGESATKPYTGQNQTLIGFAEKNNTQLPNGHVLSGLSYLAQGKDTGDHPGVFSGTPTIKDANDTDVTGNYVINTEPGTLTITPAAAEITSKKETLTEEAYKVLPESIKSKLSGVARPKAADIENGKFTYVVAENTKSVTFAYYVVVTSDKATNKSVVVNDDAAYIGSFTEGGAAVDDTKKTTKYFTVTFTDEGTAYLVFTKTFTFVEKDTVLTAQNIAQIKVEGDEPKSYPSEEGTIKKAVSVNFSDLIKKQLTITGDNTFTGATFYATLKKYNKATPLSLLDRYEDATYNLKVAFKEGDKTGKIREFVDEDGNDLKIDFTSEGTYTFRLEERKEVTSDHSDVDYDDSVYKIEVTVKQTIDTGALRVSSIQYTKVARGELVPKDPTKDPITFKNTINTGKKGSHIKIDSPNKLNTDDHFAYIIGYPDGTVQPNGEITRAEVATIFFRLLKDDVRDKYFTKTNDFSDVDQDDWFNNPVSTMAELGIVKGYPDGTFRPNEPITRAEFAAIAARFDESTRYGETRFTDVSGHWAIREIAKAYNNGWIKGYPDNTFRPNRNITRAEAMTLINRVLNRAPETEDDLLSSMNKWSDNMDVDAWYYLAVQEATNSHDYRRKTSSYEHWLRMLEDPNWAKYER